MMLEREEKTTRDCNVLSLIKVFQKATSLGKKGDEGNGLGCNAEWLSPVPMAPELTEELVYQTLVRSRAKAGDAWLLMDPSRQISTYSGRQKYNTNSNILAK